MLQLSVDLLGFVHGRTNAVSNTREMCDSMGNFIKLFCCNSYSLGRNTHSASKGSLYSGCKISSGFDSAVTVGQK